MNKLVLAIVIIGAINWGLIGLFGLDLVAWIFGGQLSLASRIIYTLAGLWAFSFFPRVAPEPSARPHAH